MEQMAGSPVGAAVGFLVGKGYVLIDRDPLHAETCCQILGQGGIR
jgi:hypothetical protein